MKDFLESANGIFFAQEKNRKIHVFLCEDDVYQLKKMEQVIRETALHNQWNLQLEIFDCAVTVLHILEERQSTKENMPDVIFTDIEMPTVNGIEFGRKLHKLAPEVYLIYITAYTEYAISGYETRAYRYLLKPLKEDMVQKILAQILCEQDNRKCIVVEKQGEQKVIALKDIVYLSSEDKYTVIHTLEDSYLNRVSLQVYEQELERLGFFRIHRKYLVNMRHHKSLKNGSVIVSGNQKLPISRRKKEEFHIKYISMLERGMFT